jgi:hypothetical protein
MGKKNYPILWLLLLFLTACSTSNPTIVSVPTKDILDGYPAIIPTQIVTGYPVPQNSNIVKVDPKILNLPKEAPLPDNGYSSLSGVLFSKGNSTILGNFRFYLTPAQGTDNNLVPPVLVGPVKTKGDISGITDKNGKFEVNNLKPGNYYLVVIMPSDYLVALMPETQDTPNIIKLAPNQRSVLGLVTVP